jgi:hypothetical protein
VAVRELVGGSRGRILLLERSLTATRGSLQFADPYREDRNSRGI